MNEQFLLHHKTSLFIRFLINLSESHMALSEQYCSTLFTGKLSEQINKHSKNTRKLPRIEPGRKTFLVHKRSNYVCQVVTLKTYYVFVVTLKDFTYCSNICNNLNIGPQYCIINTTRSFLTQLYYTSKQCMNERKKTIKTIKTMHE